MTAAPQPTWSGPYVDPIEDGWMGKRVAECMRLTPPYTTNELLDFFDNLTLLYDQYRALPPEEPHQARHPNLKIFDRTKTTDEINAVIRAGVRRNAPNAEIRAEIRQQFGVEFSPSHMTHAAKRLRQRENL